MGKNYIDIDDDQGGTLRYRKHANGRGTVHGGIVSGWVDSALGYATATVVEPGVGYNTLDLTVRYIRALRLERTPATIAAEVEHVGRSTCVVQVKVTDTDGRTCASASGVMPSIYPWWVTPM